MSDALMGAGAAANFAGTIMQMIAAKNAASNMDDVVAAMLHNQAKYRQQLAPYIESNIQYNTPGNLKAVHDATAAQALADYNAAFSQPASVPTSAPTTSAYVLPSADQVSANTALLKAAADMQGYGGMQIGQRLSGEKAARGLGLFSNLAAGKESLLPTELNAASHSADALKAGGQLLSSLGGSAAAVNAYTDYANSLNNQTGYNYATPPTGTSFGYNAKGQPVYYAPGANVWGVN